MWKEVWERREGIFHHFLEERERKRHEREESRGVGWEEERWEKEVWARAEREEKKEGALGGEGGEERRCAAE